MTTTSNIAEKTNPQVNQSLLICVFILADNCIDLYGNYMYYFLLLSLPDDFRSESYVEQYKHHTFPNVDSLTYGACVDKKYGEEHATDHPWQKLARYNLWFHHTCDSTN